MGTWGCVGGLGACVNIITICDCPLLLFSFLHLGCIIVLLCRLPPLRLPDFVVFSS